MKTQFKPEWTVILLYPDYLCDSNDHETFIALVEGETYEEAVRDAKQQAADTNHVSHMEPDDFYCIAAVRGRHDVWSDE